MANSVEKSRSAYNSKADHYDSMWENLIEVDGKMMKRFEKVMEPEQTE